MFFIHNFGHIHFTRFISTDTKTNTFVPLILLLPHPQNKGVTGKVGGGVTHYHCIIFPISFISHVLMMIRGLKACHMNNVNKLSILSSCRVLEWI